MFGLFIVFGIVCGAVGAFFGAGIGWRRARQHGG